MSGLTYGEKKGFIEGNTLSPNELHIQYGIPREEIPSFRNFTRIYPNPEVIIKEGDYENVLYLLRVGTVDVFKGAGTSRELLDTIDAVNFFGEMSMINDEPRSATVVSQTKNVVVYRIPHPNIQTILTNTKWAELLVTRLTRNLAKSLKHQVEVVDEIRELRAELEQLKKGVAIQQIRTAKNTRLALNGILYFQGAVQRVAVVGSRGWAYLNALNHVTRSLIKHYFSELLEDDKSVEINVLRAALSAFPQDEQHKIIDELNKNL